MNHGRTGVENRYAEWKSAVDSRFKVKTGNSWDDLCGDEEPLRDAYGNGLSPEEFVEHWMDKYDLEPIQASLPS